MLQPVESDQEPIFATTAQVARRLGISEATAYKWLSEGILPSQRCGSAFVIRWAAVERWIAAEDYIPSQAPTAVAILGQLTEILSGGFEIEIRPKR